MPSVKLKLNVADGLGFEDNKLKVNIGNDNLRTVTTGNDNEKGLFVDDLSNGAGLSGSFPDNWTLVTGPGTNIDTSSVHTNSFIDINRDVSNLIFTFGLYKVGSRGATQIAYTSTVKTVQDICNEIVYPLWFNASNWTSYRPNAGELLQLVTGATARSVLYGYNGDHIACEDGNRQGDNNQTTKVLFCITAIQYMSDVQPQGNAYWVKSMDLVCLYSEVPEYVVGQTYHGDQWIS